MSRPRASVAAALRRDARGEAAMPARGKVWQNCASPPLRLEGGEVHSWH